MSYLERNAARHREDDHKLLGYILVPVILFVIDLCVIDWALDGRLYTWAT